MRKEVITITFDDGTKGTITNEEDENNDNC